MQKKILVPLGILLLVAAFVFGGMKFRDVFTTSPASESSQSSTEEQTTNDTTATEDPPGFDKAQYAIDEPGSLWWVVNRQRPLPDGYVPPDLIVPDVRLRLGAGNEQMKARAVMEPALIEMFNAAAADGVTLVFGSGYRSEALQRQFYNSYVAQDGQVAADRYSARPGTSEHQTGLTFDATSTSGTCHLEICYEDTPEGTWIAANAHKYGFIIRYLEGKENVTGYQYEPWHLRYVGTELAAELKSTGQTMEEFFELEPVPFP